MVEFFFLGFWCIESHHQQIGIILLPPLPFHTHFISFSCLINLAIFSNTSQDSSTENRHPWLIPNVRGNAQVLFNTMMPKCIKAYNCIFLMTGSHQHIVSFFFSYHCFCLKYIQFDEVQFFFLFAYRFNFLESFSAILLLICM